jgi:hypothetical protein
LRDRIAARRDAARRYSTNWSPQPVPAARRAGGREWVLLNLLTLGVLTLDLALQAAVCAWGGTGWLFRYAAIGSVLVWGIEAMYLNWRYLRDSHNRT